MRQQLAALAEPASPSLEWWREGRSRSWREIEPLLPLLHAVEGREAEVARLRDGEIAERAAGLQRAARAGTDAGELLPECFALVRETARRALGERPYPVQVLAGIALHHGKLVEMQTGEGKTLAAVAPAVLNALAGRGVHVLTFNDYLARRDAGWMGPIYERLGISVAALGEGSTPEERRRAYGGDVTYVTVKEAGFDLLRDGLRLAAEEQVHRPFHLALVDEADSILIDEARIPLVIAGRIDEETIDLARLAAIARRLQRGTDFEIDEYGRNIFLTDRGGETVEALAGCGDLFTLGNARLQAEIRNALHAEALLQRDVDYIVRDGRVELVDELTGRVAEDRVWPDGLQAALEAKEGLALRPEGRILVSITIQHFLQKYPRLCGMTATARPAAGELAEVYGLAIAAVPTHRPSIRDDRPDVILAGRAAKRRAVREEIARVHATGRPVLVGTASVEESEGLAAELAAAGIPCRVLNARNDAEEAEIVAEAGAPGAVTISTNMAGRGTDIRLGGADEAECERVVALGGLYVLGTNRHESRRIDDQLRGRASRQGDPGSSRFFLSLEDDLLLRYGFARLLPARLRADLATESAAESSATAGDPAPGAIEHPIVRREIARVQRIVEGQHADSRKRLLGHALLLEGQRGAIQAWRQEVLAGHDPGGLLAERSPERWSALCQAHGAELLAGIERRLTLHAIDRCWSEHLTEMQAVRDEIHLVQLDGRDPLAEFFRIAGKAFDALTVQITEMIVETFERIEVTAAGVDWCREGLLGPSSTWTYLVNDNVFGGNAFMTLANRASFGFAAAIACAPLLFLWGAGKRWHRRRKKGKEGA